MIRCGSHEDWNGKKTNTETLAHAQAHTTAISGWQTEGGLLAGCLWGMRREWRYCLEWCEKQHVHIKKSKKSKNRCPFWDERSKVWRFGVWAHYLHVQLLCVCEWVVVIAGGCPAQILALCHLIWATGGGGQGRGGVCSSMTQRTVDWQEQWLCRN